jgi:hypothetical protein
VSVEEHCSAGSKPINVWRLREWVPAEAANPVILVINCDHQHVRVNRPQLRRVDTGSGKGEQLENECQRAKDNHCLLNILRTGKKANHSAVHANARVRKHYPPAAAEVGQKLNPRKQMKNERGAQQNSREPR